MPSLWRSTPSTAIRMGGTTFLVDCGEGTQTQLMKTKGVISPPDVNRIMVTHMHADHVLGIPGLLLAIDNANLQTRKGHTKSKTPLEKKRVEVIGPPGLYNYICSSMTMTHGKLGTLDVVVRELVGGKFSSGASSPLDPQNPWLQPSKTFSHQNISLEHVPRTPRGTWLIQDSQRMSPEELTEYLPTLPTERERMLFMKSQIGHNHGGVRPFTIEAGEVWHVDKVQSFGYVVKEMDRRPRINPERAAAKGLEPGFDFNYLKLGLPVKGEDGKEVHLSDVALDDGFGTGRKVTILGDCWSISKGMGKILEDSDVLVHEATLGDSSKKISKRRGHSVPSMAVELAIKARVKVRGLGRLAAGG